MHPYSNTSITATGIIGKNSENYGDLTDHDLSHHVYLDRPMMTPLQPWMTTGTPNDHQQSNYNQMYSNNSSFISSSPSSSSSVSTGCMPSITNAYPPPLVGGSSSALPSLSSSRSQSQQQSQQSQHRMISDTYVMPNNSHSEYQAPMAPGYHSHKQEYSPSPSPPRHRSNSIASDSSNDEREHITGSSGARATGKKREKALERNRQAALRCRQRKKEWLNQLQSNVEVLTKQNRVLEQQSLTLREEILNLKTILLAHRDCSHAHITAGSINVDNLLYRPSSTTAAATSSSPTSTTKTTSSSS